MSAKTRSALLDSVSVPCTGGLSAFATVEGRSEEGTVSSLIRSRKYAQARASALCRVASLNCLAALRK